MSFHMLSTGENLAGRPAFFRSDSVLMPLAGTFMHLDLHRLLQVFFGARLQAADHGGEALALGWIHRDDLHAEPGRVVIRLGAARLDHADDEDLAVDRLVVVVELEIERRADPEGIRVAHARVEKQATFRKIAGPEDELAIAVAAHLDERIDRDAR